MVCRKPSELDRVLRAVLWRLEGPWASSGRSRCVIRDPLGATHAFSEAWSGRFFESPKKYGKGRSIKLTSRALDAHTRHKAIQKAIQKERTKDVSAASPVVNKVVLIGVFSGCCPQDLRQMLQAARFTCASAGARVRRERTNKKRSLDEAAATNLQIRHR
jgi:hypothetical protein